MRLTSWVTALLSWPRVRLAACLLSLPIGSTALSAFSRSGPFAGGIRCCGSSLFLKRLYGVGYTMTANFTDEHGYDPSPVRTSNSALHSPLISFVLAGVVVFSSDPSKLTALVQQHIPKVDTPKVSASEASPCPLPFPRLAQPQSSRMVLARTHRLSSVCPSRRQTRSRSCLPRWTPTSSKRCLLWPLVPVSELTLFLVLMVIDIVAQGRSYGVQSYGISVTTLEEVFLKVGLSFQPTSSRCFRCCLHPVVLVADCCGCRLFCCQVDEEAHAKASSNGHKSAHCCCHCLSCDCLTDVA